MPAFLAVHLPVVLLMQGKLLVAVHSRKPQTQIRKRKRTMVVAEEAVKAMVVAAVETPRKPKSFLRRSMRLRLNSIESRERLRISTPKPLTHSTVRRNAATASSKNSKMFEQNLSISAKAISDTFKKQTKLVCLNLGKRKSEKAELILKT